MCFRLKEEKKKCWEHRTIFTQAPPLAFLLLFSSFISFLLLLFTSSKFSQCRHSSQNTTWGTRVSVPVRLSRSGLTRSHFGLQIPLRCRRGPLCCCHRCRWQPAPLCSRRSRSRWGRSGCWWRYRPGNCLPNPGEWSYRGLSASPCQRSHPEEKQWFFKPPNKQSVLIQNLCVCLYLDILEGDGLLSVEFYLLLNSLKNKISRKTSVSANMELVCLIKKYVAIKAKYSLRAISVFVWQTCSRYPEEVVEGEDVEISLVLHVQKFENILQRRRLLPVFQSQHEVKIGLIVLKRRRLQRTLRYIHWFIVAGPQSTLWTDVLDSALHHHHHHHRNNKFIQ